MNQRAVRYSVKAYSAFQTSSLVYIFAALFFCNCVGYVSAQTNRIVQTQPLTKGLFGCPLGASSEEVLKWAEARSLPMQSPSKQDLEKELKQKLRFIEMFKKQEERAASFDERFLTEIEQEAKKLMQAPSFSQAIAAQQAPEIQQYVAVLRAPTVVYRGLQYQLVGINVNLSETQPVNLAAIPKCLYILGLGASAEMREGGFDSIIIMFWKEKSQLLSYGVGGVINDQARFGKVISAMDEKYGKHVEVTEEPPGRSRIEKALFPIQPRRMWYRNIVAHDAGLIYWSPEVVSKIEAYLEGGLARAASAEREATATKEKAAKEAEANFNKKAKENF